MAKPRGQRTAASYLSKDEVKRKAQLLNLKPSKLGWKPAIQVSKKLQDCNIVEFATDKNYLNLSFEKRPAQMVILKTIYGLKLTEEELKIYQKITKNRKEFEVNIEKEEAVLVLGARSGKSLLASVIALFEATRKKWQKYLNKGESGYAVIVSTRQKQSEQVIQANCLRLMINSPNLKGQIKDSTMSELTLRNGMKIVSSPCTSLAYRGVPIIFLACDEIGHFFVEGPKADSEILNALLPRMSQFPGAKLMLVSTPSAKQESLWNYFDEGFKVSGRFTAQSESLYMNPLVDHKFLAKEKRRDIDNYNREFAAQFAEKVEAFLSYELVVNSLRLAGDLPYKEGNQYFAGIDASGLSLRDKFALAVVHEEAKNIYIDKVITWDLRDPDPIMEDIREIASTYNFNKVTIDRYARGWVASALEKIGLTVTIRGTLAEIYVNIKSLMLGSRLYLPDNEGVKKAFLNTQAYYGRNNQLSVSHERVDGSHSDDADAIATAVFEVVGGETGVRVRSLTETEEEDENWVDIRGPGYSKLPEAYHQI